MRWGSWVLKPLGPMSRVVSTFLWILIVIGAVFDVDRFSRLPFSGNSPLEISLIALTVLDLIFLVTLLIWIHRLSSRLRAQSEIKMRYTPGWAVGWFFVPVANLFMPFQAVKEIWTVVHRGTSRGSWILGLWWGLWLLSGPLRVFNYLYAGGPGLHFALARGIVLASPVVLLVVVNRLSSAYSANFSDLALTVLPVVTSPVGMAISATDLPSPAAAAGWLADPTGRHEWRYWNGTAWTRTVSSRGLQGDDPV